MTEAAGTDRDIYTTAGRGRGMANEVRRATIMPFAAGARCLECSASMRR